MMRTEVDYRAFRFRKLNTDEFRHVKLLLYWPLFGVLFYLAEQVFTARHYYPMYCALDSYIPFCELFVIPYIFWFVYMVGMHMYTLFFDIRAFRRLMYFIMVTYTIGLVIFYLFPTCQHLRPAVFPRDNALTRFMADFYSFDTSTNVCPSLHVVGSMAVMFAGWDCARLQSRGWKAAFAVCTFLISISTVFLKQHSAIDIVAGLLVSWVGYRLVYKGDWAIIKNTFRRRRVKTSS